jgi:hypothetical protein
VVRCDKAPTVGPSDACALPPQKTLNLTCTRRGKAPGRRAAGRGGSAIVTDRHLKREGERGREGEGGDR